jgi:hypothetical protein
MRDTLLVIKAPHEPTEGRAAVLRRRRMSLIGPAPLQRRPTNKRFMIPMRDKSFVLKVSHEPGF